MYSLFKVHFLMEPFCVILRRTLSSRHPLYQILQYHCRDLLIPNTIGAPVLVGEGEYMDQLFAFGSNGTDRLLNDAHPISTWNVTDFRKELKVSCYLRQLTILLFTDVRLCQQLSHAFPYMLVRKLSMSLHLLKISH